MTRLFSALGLALVFLSVISTGDIVDAREYELPHATALRHRQQNIPKLSVPRTGSRRNTTSIQLSSQHAESRSRRGNGARLTFFAPGLGACGAYNKGSDFVGFPSSRTRVFGVLTQSSLTFVRNKDRCIEHCSKFSSSNSAGISISLLLAMGWRLSLF